MYHGHEERRHEEERGCGGHHESRHERGQHRRYEESGECGCREHHGRYREEHHGCCCCCGRIHHGYGMGFGMGTRRGGMPGFGMGFRRFISKDEIISRLEEYLKELQAEAKAVEERIDELKRRGEHV